MYVCEGISYNPHTFEITGLQFDTSHNTTHNLECVQFLFEFMLVFILTLHLHNFFPENKLKKKLYWKVKIMITQSKLFFKSIFLILLLVFIVGVHAEVPIILFVPYYSFLQKLVPTLTYYSFSTIRFFSEVGRRRIFFFF